MMAETSAYQPAEVEQVLARLDGVAESAVIGVPDDRLGEVGKAFVVVKPGAAVDAALALPLYVRDKVALTTAERDAARAAARTTAATEAP